MQRSTLIGRMGRFVGVGFPRFDGKWLQFTIYQIEHDEYVFCLSEYETIPDMQPIIDLLGSVFDGESFCDYAQRFFKGVDIDILKEIVRKGFPNTKFNWIDI